MGSWRLLAILTAAVLLSGCTTVVPQGGLSAADKAELQRQQSDLAWRSTGLPIADRPADLADSATQTDSVEEWALKFVACMNEAGFDNYRANANGIRMEVSDDITDEEKLIGYECRVRFIVDFDEAGYLNPRQLNYWYDYLEQYLVPCIEMSGYAIESAPTREEFHANFGGWNPYWAIDGRAQDEAASDETLHARCPPTPPGFPSEGFFG